MRDEKGTLPCGDVGWVKSGTPTQWAQVTIHVDSGCNPMDGEFNLYVDNIIGSWELDDFDILNDSIINNFDFERLPKEGCATLFLEEDGEWDGFPHWHKYFTIKYVTIND